MRLIFASLVLVSAKERCSMRDMTELASQTAISANLEKCAQLSDPVAITNCVASVGAGSNNACIQCITSSIYPDQMECLVNCANGSQTTGCDECSLSLLNGLKATCIPAVLPGKHPESIDDIAAILPPSMGHGSHHEVGGHSSNHAKRCGMKDIRRILPRGNADMDTMIQCFTAATTQSAFIACLPEETGNNKNRVCTDCLTTVLYQGYQLGCLDVCQPSNSAPVCRTCLVGMISAGLGRCTGASEPPAETVCDAADLSTYTATGKDVLLNCVKADPTKVADCLSTGTTIKATCITCLAAAPAWASTPCNPSDTNCVAPAVDTVFADHCFDPNSLQKPETEETVTMPCSLDDFSLVAQAGDTLASCLSTGSGSATSTCLSATSSSSTCQQCIQGGLPSTCASQSASCWDDAVATSSGTCMYSGYTVKAIADGALTKASTHPAPLWVVAILSIVYIFTN